MAILKAGDRIRLRVDHPMGYIEGEFIEVVHRGTEILCKIRLDPIFVEPEELEVKIEPDEPPQVIDCPG